MRRGKIACVLVWQTYVSDVGVLERAQSHRVNSMIFQYRLRSIGHVVRMAEKRIPKQLLYDELVNGKCTAQKPKTRYN